MSDDLISRQAAIDAIRELESGEDFNFNNGLICAMNNIAELPSLSQIAYEQGVKDTLDKYDETFRIASEIRTAMGCKTASECWELIRNGDIQRIKHGHWINYKDNHQCSCCREIIIDDWISCDDEYDYCPNCGARMDGEENGI